MPEFFIALGIILVLTAATVALSYYCFIRTFYNPRNKPEAEIGDVTAKVADNFTPFRMRIGEWRREVEGMQGQPFEITSFDGLRLNATYYEYEKGAPIEIMFHGYKGSGHRDLCGGVIRAAKQGRSTLMVDHRASGDSEGSVISFGINESRDCRAWIDLVLEKIDKDAKIILTGISMGAATVLITAGRDDLPENVVGVIADCGYTSPKEIIKKTAKEMGFPPTLTYPFIKLGGRIFGHFNVDELSPLEAMKKCKLPVIFFHGDCDDFVPYEMSERNFEMCASERKKLVAIEGAGHGVAYPVDEETYLAALAEFFEDIL